MLRAIELTSDQMLPVEACGPCHWTGAFGDLHLAGRQAGSQTDRQTDRQTGMAFWHVCGSGRWGDRKCEFEFELALKSDQRQNFTKHADVIGRCPTISPRRGTVLLGN